MKTLCPYLIVLAVFIGVFCKSCSKGKAVNDPTQKEIETLLKRSRTASKKRLTLCRKALDMAKKSNYGLLKGRAYLRFGDALQTKGKYVEAAPYFDSAKTIFRERNNNKYLSTALYKQGSNQIYLGNFNEAEEIFSRALTLAKLMEDSSSMASYLQNLSITYLQRNELTTALTYNQQALDISLNVRDSMGIAHCTRQRGNIYKHLKKPRKAITHYKNALQVFRALNYQQGIALTTSSLGKVYKNMDDYDMAMNYFKRSLEIARQKKSYAAIADNLKSMGDIFFEKNQLDKAKRYYRKALKLERRMQSQYKIALILLKMGMLNNEINEYNKAVNFLRKSATLFNRSGTDKKVIKAYKALSESYSALGDFNNAYSYLNRYTQKHDSIFEIEQENRLEQVEERYEVNKRKQRLKLQEAKLARKNAELKHQQARQNALIVSFVIMVLLVAFITFFYFQKRKANKAIQKQNEKISKKNAQLQQKNEEITVQRDEIINQRDEIINQKDEIEKQKDEIDKQRDTLLWQTKEITDSILYARYIQRAMLPAKSVFSDALKDYFIYYKPRDIVSGDFYWAKKINHLTYIAAVDCSGHGVPGAFMSMLGFAFLNEIINYKNPLHTNQVIDELRETVKDALGHTDAKEGIREGMSISLCRIDHNEQKMEFSGAFNPLYQFRDGDLTRHKADRQPVAIYFNEKPFTRKTINYKEGDTFYIFTDGYSDQFGGKEGKKFKKKPFQQLLLQLHQEPMKVQEELINKNMAEWMSGDYYQVDDILVIGFRII